MQYGSHPQRPRECSIAGCSFTYSNLSLQKIWEFTIKDVNTINLFKQKLKIKARVPINTVTRMEQYDRQRAS